MRRTQSSSCTTEILIDGVGLTNLIREIKPTEVYNLGAQSHVQVSFTMPQYTGQVDAVGAVGLA